MIPVLVPWRPDNGPRDRLWEHLQKHFWADLTDFRVVTGVSPDGPFNRSAAVNDAARKADSWDVAVISDNDTWVPEPQLMAAVEKTTQSGRLTSAFTSVIELSQSCTEAIVQNRLTMADLGVQNVRTDPLGTQSSMLVINRDLWDRVGGFDERFKGWSAEDNAFWRSCELAAGAPNRIPGAAFHLWHAPGINNRRHPNYLANQRLWRRYEQARTEAELP